MIQPPPPLFTRPPSEYDAMMVAASLRFEGCSHVETAILLRQMFDKLLRHFTLSERLQYERHYAEHSKSIDAGGVA
jgi:hypothetical protein